MHGIDHLKCSSSELKSDKQLSKLLYCHYSWTSYSHVAIWFTVTRWSCVQTVRTILRSFALSLRAKYSMADLNCCTYGLHSVMVSCALSKIHYSDCYSRCGPDGTPTHGQDRGNRAGQRWVTTMLGKRTSNVMINFTLYMHPRIEARHRYLPNSDKCHCQHVVILFEDCL